jgi:coenzyme F420-dependent glucose-6-phosphate dehydrogenase
MADERMSDEQFAEEGFLVSAEIERHVGRLSQMADLGANVICTQLIGQADPLGTIRAYGDHVLPALRRHASPAGRR